MYATWLSIPDITKTNKTTIPTLPPPTFLTKRFSNGFRRRQTLSSFKPRLLLLTLPFSRRRSDWLPSHPPESVTGRCRQHSPLCTHLPRTPCSSSPQRRDTFSHSNAGYPCSGEVAPGCVWDQATHTTRLHTIAWRHRQTLSVTQLGLYVTQIDCQRYTLGLSVSDTNRLSALHAGITCCVRDTNRLSALHAGIICM